MSDEAPDAGSTRYQNESSEAVALTQQHLAAELSRARSELDAQSRLTRKEVNNELSRTRAELHAELSRTRSELNEGLSHTRKELSKDARRFTLRDWLQIVVMPFAFIITAAILGMIFQDRSFRKNTLFQTQYERLLTAQKEAVSQSQDLSSVLNTLKRWEETSKEYPSFCSAENFSPLIEQLKRFELRSKALKDYSKGAGTSTVLDEALSNYSQKIADVIKCESSYPLNQCQASCDKNLGELRDASQATIYSHNALLNDLINKSK